jgi:uncharacterized protein (TIGR02271 family)
MLTEEEARDVIGKNAIGSDGQKIGKIGQLFFDDESGRPEFVTVQTGLFGTHESFVPVQDASVTGDGLTVPFTKDAVKDAPNVDVESGHLDRDEEQRLYEHYGLSYGSGTGNGYAGTETSGTETSGTGYAGTDTTTGTGYSDTGTTTGTGTVAPEGHDTSGPNTDDAMTRSEERVDVGTTQEEAGRVRLRKYVTTEQETHTVPVRTERAVIEREPVTGDNVGAATSGADLSEEEHEVVLNRERAVVDKTVEPVERVRLGTETETHEETVTEDVRKEHIEADGDVDDRTR